MKKSDREEIIAEVLLRIQSQRRRRFACWARWGYDGGLGVVGVLCVLRAFGVI